MPPAQALARRYVGEWKEGRMHGHGVKTDAEGNLYEGEWSEGKIVLKDQGAGLDKMLPWLNEAIGSVTTGRGDGGRGKYSAVPTHDDDEEDSRRR